MRNGEPWIGKRPRQPSRGARPGAVPAAGRGRPQTAMRCVAAQQPGPPQAWAPCRLPSSLPPSFPLSLPRPPGRGPARTPLPARPLSTAARPAGSRPRPRPCGAGRSPAPPGAGSSSPAGEEPREKGSGRSHLARSAAGRRSGLPPTPRSPGLPDSARPLPLPAPRRRASAASTQGPRWRAAKPAPTTSDLTAPRARATPRTAAHVTPRRAAVREARGARERPLAVGSGGFPQREAWLARPLLSRALVCARGGLALGRGPKL